MQKTQFITPVNGIMTHRKQQKQKMVITFLQHITYADCCCWMFDTITMLIAQNTKGGQ